MEKTLPDDAQQNGKLFMSTKKYSVTMENEQKEGEVKIKNKKFVEIAATISGSLTKFSTGIFIAWSSPSLPQLTSDDSPIPITSSEGAWITAMMQVGSFVAVFIMALTVDVIGRKRAILFSAIPVLISWILISQATTPMGLAIARFIGGLGSGYGKIIIGTYIGEIAEPSIRGALGTFMGITYILGVLFVYSIGPFVSVQTFAYVAMGAPILLFITFMWMPETPYFHLMRGSPEKARITLEQLRGHSMVDEEFDRIAKGIQRRTKMNVSLRKLFYERSNRKPLLVICVLFLSIQFSGKVPILAYCQTIFENTGGGIPAYLSAIITGLIQLFALIFSTFTIDKSGRRKLLIMSCFGTGVSLGSLTIYFFIKDQLQWNTENINWIPLTSLIIYNLVFNIGLGNVPFIMVGELFQSDVKSVAVCLTSICLPMSSVINIKLFQFLRDTYGIYTSFLLYTMTAFLCALYCKFYVPETKGKSLEEIQEFFQRKEQTNHEK